MGTSSHFQYQSRHPQVFTPVDTSSRHSFINASLILLLLFSLWNALWLSLVLAVLSIVSTLSFNAIWKKLSGNKVADGGETLQWAMLLALFLPKNSHPLMIVLASCFMIFVIKAPLGGGGAFG